MVRLTPLLSAAFLFSAALAAPAVRRTDDISVSSGSSDGSISVSSGSSDGSISVSSGGSDGGISVSSGSSDGSSCSSSDCGAQAESSSVDSTSTAAETATSTSSSAAMSTMYGSGSSNWGSDYNSCVQQCVANYGMPDSMATATPTATQGSTGTGATHTVVVAPTQGVLRYIPFAVNASVGDTVRFEWHANGHTVTKGSVLEICNKTSDALFTSGLQNNSFVFEQVVNDTKPVWFFCNAPTHCQKGMFGVINPPSALVLPNSVAASMSSMVAASAPLKAMQAYTDARTANSTFAAKWGGNMDITAVPAQYRESFAENVQFTRAFLGANPDVIQGDKVNLGAASGPLMFPEDVSTSMPAAGADGYGAPAAPASSGAAAAPSGAAAAGASPSPASAAKTNGAASRAFSGLTVGVVAVVATFFAL